MQAALSTLSEAEISALLAQLRSSSCSTQDLNASLARALLNYSNLNVPGIARQSSKLLPHSWSFTYSAPPSIDLKGKEVAAVSILIPSQGHTHSGCRYLIGNRIHEMLNAAVISLAFGLQLARPNKQSYTCGGLFDSTGRYEKLPVKDPRKAQTFCEPPCNFDRDIRRNKPPRMMSSTLALRLVNNSARFQAQEAAMTSWLPRARQKRLFAYGPHASMERSSSTFFNSNGAVRVSSSRTEEVLAIALSSACTYATACRVCMATRSSITQSRRSRGLWTRVNAQSASCW